MSIVPTPSRPLATLTVIAGVALLAAMSLSTPADTQRHSATRYEAVPPAGPRV